MRHVLAFLEWKSNWWLDHRNSRVDVSGDHNEGLRAYAQTQADLQQALREHFCAIWKAPLTESNQMDSNAIGEQDMPAGGAGGDDDDDDDDDDDEDEDEEGAEGQDVDAHNNDDDADELA